MHLVEQRPGITVAELAETMGVSLNRGWQYIGRLERGFVRRECAAADVRLGKR